jgi:hypothetical protein
MRVRSLFYICSVLLLLFSSALAYENLDELEMRTSRKGSNTFYSGENASNYYIWQPQTVSYVDTSTDHEVWIWTQTDDAHVMTESTSWLLTEWPWRLWSADGKRIALHIQKDIGKFSRGSGKPWFVSRSDGSYLRPANASSRCVWDGGRYFNWSPVEPDITYKIGDTQCSRTGLDRNSIYKNTILDTSVSYTQWVDLKAGDTTDQYGETKRSITDDGMYMVVPDSSSGGNYREPLHIAEIYKITPVGVEATSWDFPEFDTDWGATVNTVEFHDTATVGSGSPAGNYWIYAYNDSPNAARWRIRLSAIDGEGALDWDNPPEHTSDTSSPYAWWGTTAEMDSAREVQLWNTNHTPQPTGSYPSEGAGHMDFDPWGRYAIIADGDPPSGGIGPTVVDIDDASYQAWNLGSATYCSWGMWTDYPICTADGGSVFAMNYLTGATDNLRVFDMNLVSGTNGRAYAGLSPDGTKAATNTDWLNPTSQHGDLIIGVVFYPYPPEITSSIAAGGIVTTTFEWMLDSTPRGHVTRGWPNETTDDPPPPRETEKFRLWRSSDKLTWTPLGTTDANIFSRYNFKTGVWSGSDSWTITDSPGDGTWYYAVTAAEWSGLESRTLSNIYSITVSGGNVTGSQDMAYPSSPGDLDDISASDFYNSFNTENNSLIRYYNIYAEDGSNPTVSQENRIGSISVNACSDGKCSWVDWLGNTTGITRYAVTAVDSQGNESDSRYVTAVSYDHRKSPAAAAPGQYTVEWNNSRSIDYLAPPGNLRIVPSG